MLARDKGGVVLTWNIVVGWIRDIVRNGLDYKIMGTIKEAGNKSETVKGKR
jgi:hypothetical protein